MKNILIIDDEESIRFSFKAHLSREGHEVLTAEDYESALAVIANTDLDLIIADIILGGQTGIDILHQVKERSMRCPVIMVTGAPDLETATEAVRLGAFDYLPKPVRKETLLRVAGQALRYKALLDEKERIALENERYRRNLDAIFRSIRDAVITVDDNLCVIEANESTNRICGLSPSDIIGQRLTECSAGCRKWCLDALHETLKTKNTIEEYRVECKRKDRPGQVVLLTCSPLMAQSGRSMGAVLVIRDITKVTDLERELGERRRFHNIIGKSDEMRKVYRLIEDLTGTETSVLITGESGVGKELIAHALHYEGVRAAKPLVTINCSALNENLLESELFGHVKGAFTGAVKNKIGRFKMADGGAVFLDEIGDISPRIQLKLLRFLQESEFEPVGDSSPVKVDVRIIAATNCNLKEKVKSGEFREDLYYRIKVVEIPLPPLRERRDDIPLLIDHFKTLFSRKFKKEIDGISSDVLSIFMHYPWPGNIRELEHAMEHAFVLCHGRTITVDHLPSEIVAHVPIKSPAPLNTPANDPQDILHALNKTDWNKAKAARRLGISRRTIYRKIIEHKLTKPVE